MSIGRTGLHQIAQRRILQCGCVIAPPAVDVQGRHIADRYLVAGAGERTRAEAQRGRVIASRAD